jgi:hypothetical protein
LALIVSVRGLEPIPERALNAALERPTDAGRPGLGTSVDDDAVEPCRLNE